MRVDQSKLVPLKLKRLDKPWVQEKRTCVRDLVSTSLVSHPGIFEFPVFNRMQSESFPYLYEADSSTVISAPTASGKTALMELGILRNLETSKGKVLYLAPLKALCQERRLDWSRRLSRVGLKCVEVTGDSDESDLTNFRQADVILATPEKWDSVTRKGFSHISLLLIDEVHILEQESRGATLEAVVSRMKMLLGRFGKTPLRIIAISATIPNINDIAVWLGASVVLNYDSSYRPVPLTTKVLGYQKAQNQFKFEQALNFKLLGVIQRYSEGKATLVFCQTQKGTVNAAKRLAQDAGQSLISSQAQFARLTQAAHTLRDRQCAETLTSAIGFHNAGLSPEDRTQIEQLFLSGDLLVLCTTSTLAIGVNLPCHLVVVKSTMAYRGNAEGYTEYSSLEVLQMIGRAGRPQFDQSGMAVIMTEIDKIKKYESLMLAQEVIESALAKSMIEHINAEVALGSITCEEEAITWLKSTFFYTRARLNPEYYKLSKDVDGELGSISKEHLQRLEHFHLIQRQGEKFASTTLGRACSSNCVQVNTIIGFTESIHMDMSAEDVLKAIAAAQEFVGYPSKLDQRKYLNLLNTQSSLRYRIKGAVNSYEKKVFLLLQAALSGCVIDSWELRQQLNSILQVSRRVVNVLREYCLFHDLGFPLSKTLLWGRQFAAKMWNEDPLVCKQIAGIGEKLATALAQGGIKTLSDLTSSDPRKVEYLCGKNPPFGTNVKSFANGIPRFQMTAELLANTLNIALMTVCTYHPDVRNTAALLLSSVSGSVIAYRRLDASQTNQGFSFCVKQENLPIRATVILDNFGMEGNWVPESKPELEQFAFDTGNTSPIKEENEPEEIVTEVMEEGDYSEDADKPLENGPEEIQASETHEAEKKEGLGACEPVGKDAGPIQDSFFLGMKQDKKFCQRKYPKDDPKPTNPSLESFRPNPSIQKSEIFAVPKPLKVTQVATCPNPSPKLEVSSQGRQRFPMNESQPGVSSLYSPPELSSTVFPNLCELVAAPAFTNQEVPRETGIENQRIGDQGWKSFLSQSTGSVALTDITNFRKSFKAPQIQVVEPSLSASLQLTEVQNGLTLRHFSKSPMRQLSRLVCPLASARVPAQERLSQLDSLFDDI